MITSRRKEKAYTGQMIAAIIIKNRGMQSCFKFAWCLAVTAAAALAPEAVFASSVQPVGQQPVRVRSVVRADKSGRLVRAYVVSPKAMKPKSASDAARTNHAPVAELVDAVAKKYDVDPLLVHSVIQVESGYNPYAVSNKGAQGLMQLMPGTARRFGVTNSFDTMDNLEGGVRYLKYLDSLFPNDLRLTIAAYNAGEGAVWKYRNTIPPYPETEQYVQKVGTRYGKALREAEKKKTARPVAHSAAAAVSLEPSYAHVESFIDSDGRLHLRTGSQGVQGSNAVITP
jgi:soluble lytic murein transglycosylase-like protein